VDPPALGRGLAKVKRVSAASFDLYLGNDGSVVGDFTVAACGKSKGFAMAYRSRGFDVTANVVAGAYGRGRPVAGRRDDVGARDHGAADGNSR
jgi:hypothetical protein